MWQRSETAGNAEHLNAFSGAQKPNQMPPPVMETQSSQNEERC